MKRTAHQSRPYPLWALLVSTFIATACATSGGEQEPAAATTTAQPTLFEQLDSTRTGIGFVNQLVETETWNILRYEYLFNGAGVGVGDVNNDGLADLYFVSNSGADRLYLNEGGFRFRDISAQAGIDQARGYKTGVSMADVNGDGHLDIHVCRDALNEPDLRRNLLYINNGDLTFTESAQAYGLDDASFSTQAYFFDMDLDGDLDMYLVNHPGDMREANNINAVQQGDGTLRVHQREDLTYISDRLYRQDKGRFTDISDKAGIRNEAFGLSAAVGDFNSDGLPDIYVCNDYVKPDQLWLNHGNGTFTDEFNAHFANSSFSSMGSDLADVNNDGLPDLITADMTARDHYRYQSLGMVANYDKYSSMLSVGLGAQFSSNALQLNNGNGTFSNIGALSNMAYTDWSWSTLLADLDNDGWNDALITNGYLRDVNNSDYLRYTMDSLQKELRQGRISLLEWITAIPSVKVRSFLFRNEGDLTFSDRSAEWNAGPAAFSNGAAYADLDNDGFLDLVYNNINDPATILRNTGAAQVGTDHIRIALDAGKGRTAIGAKVVLSLADGTLRTQWIQPGRGFLSCSEPIAHFGTGAQNKVAQVAITWPDGALQTISAPELNKVHRITRGEDLQRATRATRPSSPYTDLSNDLPRTAWHQENPYIDFKREPLLHHQLSAEGPAACVGDVNGDGLDDLFLGGAMDSPGKLFVQQRDGSFTAHPAPDLEADAVHEDVAALFLDVDGDGDLDLLVGSGGNERPNNDPAYQDRLYRNDGSGKFVRDLAALPKATNSTACIVAGDMDGDGDPDLFVGGRVVPGRYPEAPASQFLRNDGGRFTDVTLHVAAAFHRMGMVTQAQFADLDGDDVLELIVVGEWMPVTVLKWDTDHYVDMTEQLGLAESTGWWCSVSVADPEGDGYPDILAGNVGLNSVLRTSPTEPVTMHYKDFDGNGTVDPVMCAYWEGRPYPVHMRDRMLDQMIMLKKRFLRYHTYATASLEQLFRPEELNGARTLKANTFASTRFRNARGTSFTATPLPHVAQLSMARAMRWLDVDSDGHPDVLVAGNHYDTDAQFGRYDASQGAVLRGDGTGSLTPTSMEGGPFLGGNVRHALPIRVADRPCLLVVRNNGPCGLIRLPKPVVP